MVVGSGCLRFRAQAGARRRIAQLPKGSGGHDVTAQHAASSATVLQSTEVI